MAFLLLHNYTDFISFSKPIINKTKIDKSINGKNKEVAKKPIIIIK